MKKFLFSLLALVISATALQAKTLVVYYSFTNNCRKIATDLKGVLKDADLIEVQPADEGLDYAANGYEIGRALISAIRNNPEDAASYPAIKNVTADVSHYDDIVIVTPLWWSSMAAPMQTYLFHNGSVMVGKKIGLIVSSASSGISGVVADAKRLVPQGNFTESLWVRSSQVSNCHSMITNWVSATGIGTTAGVSDVKVEAGNVIRVNNGKLLVSGDFANVAIYDMTGKIVMTSTNKETCIYGLTPSVYVARINGASASRSYKFLVK